MDLFVIGINHESAPAEVREQFAFGDERPFPMEIGEKLSEHFFFSTCNRAELYGTADDSRSAATYAREVLTDAARISTSDDIWYTHHGPQALAHLFRVASSLDAMVVGEAQVLGQLKEAFHASMRAGKTGPVLNRALHRALRVAKRIRRETELARKPVSVASIAVEFISEQLGDLKDKHCLVVGAGEMGGLVVQQLKSRGMVGLIVINRTFDRAEALAEHAHGRAYRWEQLPTALAMSDVVIVCTGADEPIIDEEMMRDALASRGDHPVAIVDLGVPRAVASSVGDLEPIWLTNIDSLRKTAVANLASRQTEANAAERIVTEEVVRYRDEMQGSLAGKLIMHITKRAEKIRQGEIEKLYRVLPELDNRERTALEAAMRAVTSKILHDPISRLKKMARSQPERDWLEAFIEDLFPKQS